MAKKAIDVLKSYFETGDQPTQPQFSDLIDSFFHKDGTISIENITGLTEILQGLENIQISDVQGLQDALDSLANIQISDVQNLQAVLDSLQTRNISDIAGLTEALNDINTLLGTINNSYVHQEAGKGLSTEDFTTVLKEKLENIVTGGIELKGVFLNNGDAISGGLFPGDFYRIPITSASEASVIAMVVDIVEESGFKLTFADLDAFATANAIDKNEVSSWNSKFTGQGSSTANSVVIDGNSATFSVNAETFVSISLGLFELVAIEITNLNNLLIFNVDTNSISSINYESLPDTITDLNLSGNPLGGFEPSKLPANLNSLTLNYTQLSFFLPVNALPSGLTSLALNHNSLEIFSPSVPLPDSLVSLEITDNLLTNFNFDLSNTSLTDIALNQNSISEFNFGETMNSLLHLRMNSNALTEFDPVTLFPVLNTLSVNSNALMTSVNYSGLSNTIVNIDFSSCGLTSFDPVSLPSALKTLSLTNNNIGNFNPSNALPSGIETLHLSGIGMTVFNPTIALPSSLHLLNLNNNNMSFFNPTVPLPSGLMLLYMAFNNINTAGWAFADWVSSISPNGNFSCYANPNPVTGTATETALLAKGWGITT